MKKSGIPVIILVSAAVMLLYGCDFFLAPVKPLEGNLTILTGNTARSVSPEAAASFRYEFDFSGPGGESYQERPPAGTTSVSLSVSPGEWTITVRAYTPLPDGGEIPAGTGRVI
ncbi:hypothetical protein LQZ19_17850, partial [Treponema primitia]|uniref:hypothetical protein n=1 Tax=Treponema primitia TaxID=88058 RepID=UPI0039811A4F